MPHFQFQPYQSGLTGTIADLIAAPGRIRANALRQGGEAQARAQQASGQTWGNAIGSIGQIASGAVQQYGEQQQAEQVKQQQTARDNAIRSLVPGLLSGEVRPDAFLGAVGVKDGVPVLNALKGFGELTAGKVANPQKTAGDLAQGLKVLPPDLRGQLWPQVRAAAIKGGLGDEQTLPQEPSDQFLDAIIAWSSGKAPEPVKTVPVDTAGPDGKPVTQFVTPTPGASYPKPEPAPKPDQPVVRVNPRTGKMETIGTAPAGAHFVQEPAPPKVTVNTGGAEPEVAPDPASANILAQTGLNINAFRYLTGQASQLARDAATRTKAARDAERWARAHNVDISTIAQQYKSQNEVLGANISRLNNTKIMEQELAGTVENLQTVSKSLGSVKFANVWKLWAGEQVNDPTAQQYAVHLGQLRNELAAYYAAAAGRPGSGITVADTADAERTIKNGISQGGLTGVMNAVHDATAKMGPIMQASVDRAQQAIWSLFGVGQNYKSKTAGATPPPAAGGATFSVTAPDGKTYRFPTQQALDAFKRTAGIK